MYYIHIEKTPTITEMSDTRETRSLILGILWKEGLKYESPDNLKYGPFHITQVVNITLIWVLA